METLEEAMEEAIALSDETLIEPINDILFVNPEERTIEIPVTELLLGVYSDRNVERKYFKCPRIVGDNIDLSLCYMFINYVSSSGTIGQQQCNDVKLDKTGNYITFSWLLSGNVFDKNIDSKVYFSVQAKMPNGENVFNTRKVSGDVYETVEAGEEITEEYADIILQIISRIDELEQGGGITQEQIEQALNKYLETNPIEVPTKLSDLQEDETHRTVTDVEKEQWNKSEENVQSDWNETDTTSDSFIKNKPSIPNKTSDLQNDSGFLTEHQDLSGYALKSEVPKSASDVGADVRGTAESKVSAHNTSGDAHNDIRLLVQGLIERLNALADSDDETLDQMSEVVAYIKSNKSLIDAITTGKVSVSDIIDNLTTNVSNKPLSAAQGVKLKALIDAIVVPTKLSELENDSGYAKTTDIPDKLPNPQKLTFAGAVTAEYDGSGAVTVTIPEGSGGSGGTVRIEKESTDTAVELEPNKLYIFPEMSELTITLAEPSDTGIANEYHFVFQSGATATTLSIPDAIKIHSGFSVDANKIYEISILEGCLCAQNWEVTA